MEWRDGLSSEDKFLFLVCLISSAPFLIIGLLEIDLIATPLLSLLFVFFLFLLVREIQNLLIINDKGMIMGDLTIKDRGVVIKKKKKLLKWNNIEKIKIKNKVLGGFHVSRLASFVSVKTTDNKMFLWRIHKPDQMISFLQKIKKGTLISN